MSFLTNNKYRSAIIVVFIALGALAVILATKPTPSSAPLPGGANLTGVSGALVAEAAEYDFGAVPLRGGLVRNTYRVTNNGAAPLTIEGVSTSCMCTTAVVRKGSESWGPFGMPGHGPRRAIRVDLAPGEVAEVEVTFDPAAHGPAGVGPVSRAVFLEHSSGDPLVLSFTALVTP